MSKYEVDTPDYKVKAGCMESYPCQHYVEIAGKNATSMYAPAIYKDLVARGIPIPEHFEYVKGWIAKYETPHA